MSFEKKDSFTPKRYTNVDGFSSDPTQDRPRQPAFRNTPASHHSASHLLKDMPKRGQPQPVLTSRSDVVTAMQPSALTAAPNKDGERRRGRRHGDESSEPQEPHKKHKPRSIKKIIKRTGLLLGVAILASGLWFGFKFYKDIAKLTGDDNPLALLSILHPAPLENQNGRVNILVAGNSTDDPGHDGASLTDSIMILSLDTNNNTAFMLSVPRDLWVNIPGVGYAKINDAYPNGGMNTLQQVIQNDLGVTIDYQVLVNYGAFRDLVNAVGGISIDVQSPDPRGLYDPYTHVNLPNGWVTLDGQQALNLARARGDGPGSYGFPSADFDRTEHQRQMVLAIKNKASQSSVIANPLKISEIVDAIGNNVTTNMQLDEVESLYSHMKKVNDNNIGSYNVSTLAGPNTSLLVSYYAPGGQDALIPAAGFDNFTQIQAQIQHILSSNAD